jgi:RimJ/RimL family protein N-acetyltransferase
MTPVCPAPQVVLRELGPGDGPVLDAVFAGLSAASRLRRFHAPMPRLSRAMREHLAAVDGHRHVAVAAFAADPDAADAAGPGEPVGIARLVRFADGPAGRVELAVEVVDAWQRSGVGTALVSAVLERGRAAGQHEVAADVLAENLPMRRLLFALLPDPAVVGSGPEITVTSPLPAVPGRRAA